MKDHSLLVSAAFLCAIMMGCMAPQPHTPAEHDDSNMNAGKPPEDWWAEIERYHGHTGPWNVLGYRMGQRALSEFGEEWGSHKIEVICHAPMKTPYTCLVDGLGVGTGNTLGRLDLKLAEAPSLEAICVEFKQIATGKKLIMRPDTAYLVRIEKAAQEGMNRLAHQCAEMPDSSLFSISRE